MLTSKQRANLRSMANTMDTILYVGKDGITDNTVKEAYDALEARELIKVTVQRNAPYTAREACEELCAQVHAEPVPVIGNRSFSDDPVLAGEYGCAYLEGLHDTGTIAALKHFPGHGNTATDSHTGFPLINSTYEELKECELIPFQTAIDSGGFFLNFSLVDVVLSTKCYQTVFEGYTCRLPILPFFFKKDNY